MDYMEITYEQLGDWVKPESKIVISQEWFLSLMKDHKQPPNTKKPRTFYVCSYGGCGSKMLSKALSDYGDVEHIHSRNLPEKLEYVGKNGGGKSYVEWFNGVKIPESEVENYSVIYIYRNPVKAIFTQFTSHTHLQHLKIDDNTKLIDVANNLEDLYKIKEFHNNYTKENKNRNFKVYLIKYEDIFDNLNEISKTLKIGKLNIDRRDEKIRSAKKDGRRGAEGVEDDQYIKERLNILYKDLIDEQNSLKPIVEI